MVACSAAACTLLTDLDGLAGPPAGETDAALDAAVTVRDASADAEGDAAARVSYADEVGRDHPVVYLRLGDDALPAAHDQRPAGDAIFMGTSVVLGRPSLLAGDPDPSVRLEGTGRIVLPYVARLFTGTLPYSVEAWIAVDAAAGGPLRWLLGRDDTGGDRSGVSIFVDPGTGMAMERWAVSRPASRVTGALPRPGAASHVVATYDGGRMQIWVDGIPSGTVSSPLEIPDNGYSIVVGSQSTQQTAFFQGGIDEVALYDHALPIDRILAHWHAGTGK
ncbi:MAG: Autotransporter adhesin [Labilithrix sp.]|nr:Autotransporter adhesin [Labilithrix sp.]